MSNLNHTHEECVYCDTTFSVVTDDPDDEVVFCPFCGEELFEDDEDDYEDDDDWDDED